MCMQVGLAEATQTGKVRSHVPENTTPYLRPAFLSSLLSHMPRPFAVR